MNCIQYYNQLGIDLSPLSGEERNVIASFFLENMIFTKEEIENLFKIEKSEKIEGGLADGKSIEEIAIHHNTSVEQISKQLEIGIKVEMEHTNDREKAEEIAKDHLWEIPDYYTRLDKMESEAKENLSKGFSHKYIRREGVPGNYKYFYANEKGEESSYEESNSIIDRVIELLEEPIQQITHKLEETELEERGVNFTQYDKEMIRLDLLSDLTSALGKYLKQGDELIESHTNISKKNNFEIYIKVNRDNEPHYLTTEAIYAGGQNIQRLHYRYITKTSLPIIKTPLENKYAEKIKKLKKEAKITRDIVNMENSLEKLEQKVKQDKELTDEQILDRSEYWQGIKDTTWEDIVNRGADKNYKDKEAFEDSQNKYKKHIIDSFRKMITFDETSILSMKKTIGKLESKIESKVDEIEKAKRAEIEDRMMYDSDLSLEKISEKPVEQKEDTEENEEQV